jgi:hypothetical protein
MELCAIDANGEVRMHQNIRLEPLAFLPAVQPFREDGVACVERLAT